jgi:hypothetical protein
MTQGFSPAGTPAPVFPWPSPQSNFATVSLPVSVVSGKILANHSVTKLGKSPFPINIQSFLGFPLSPVGGEGFIAGANILTAV